MPCSTVPRLPLAVLVFLSACRPGPESDPGSATPREADRSPAAETPVPETPETRPAAATGPDFLAIRYRALGTEPFWGVEVTADSLVLERPDADPVHFRVTKVRRWAGTDVLTGRTGGTSIEITIERRPCSDGMSDRQYAFSSRVSFGDERLTGCAFERPLEMATGGEGPTDPVAGAGLTDAVREARDIRARQSSLDRYVGSLGSGDASRAMFAAYFDGDDVRMIEFRRSLDETILRETTYYFAGRGGDRPPPSLIDGEMRSGAEDPATWFLLGFDVAGTATGQLVEVGGTPVEPPPGLVNEELERARDLVVEARRARD